MCILKWVHMHYFMYFVFILFFWHSHSFYLWLCKWILHSLFEKLQIHVNDMIVIDFNSWYLGARWVSEIFIYCMVWVFFFKIFKFLFPHSLKKSEQNRFAYFFFFCRLLRRILFPFQFLTSVLHVKAQAGGCDKIDVHSCINHAYINML